ncbi:MAG: leucine-rich repeat protein [Spirulina sp. SIO3F2]|nr:leucine-rich repeat protein [Spirulina sp. SIO3F2]
MTRAEVLALIERAAAEGWRELDLSGAGLTELPPEIGQLTQLESLILGKQGDGLELVNGLAMRTVVSNSLTHLPRELANLTNLKRLDISGNPLVESISDWITLVKKIESLTWIRAELTEIPAAIASLQNLQSLHLDSNQISVIPDAIASLQNLETLHLNSNQISVIPDAIASLQNLETLHLNSNQISVIPDALASLQNLETLHLFNNQISVIPDALASLQNLETLHLFNNQISVIPDALASLQSLQTLNLSSNQISVIPDALASLQNLQSLDLRNNQISVIPDAIASLQNLQSLYLRNNQISVIPEAIASLQNLQSLDLRNNQISVIPEAIASLQNLQSLDLRNNQISVIPEAIAQLQTLESLNLFNNQISVIPDAIETLPKLKALDFRQNQLHISPEVLQDYENPHSIFNYLQKLRSGEAKPLNEAKLLLVGEGSVGKTSLVNRLIDDKFNPHEHQTDGLSVRQWPIEVNNQAVRVNVWDFGGQEIYHATHQFFLTKRSLYLLVCDCRTSEEKNRLEYWLKLIQTFGGGSPVIIVGNKKDEQPFDINRRALREKYPNTITILETSCETGDGINELRHTIIEQVGNLKEVYDLLPLDWFEVKEQLENMSEDFISFAEYIRICCDHQIREEQDQAQLIDLLHDLGLVLNFRKHPILQSTKVLNPNWVTTGIYAILSDETLKTQTEGMLTLDDLSRILKPEERYPTQRHHYLTELMKEFQLCFELPNCPDAHRFLIPGLLLKDEPNQTSLEGDTLEFEYHYLVLPGSIISRFIVLSHERIYNQIRWRSGVMLAYREGEGEDVYNIARIKSDPEDKKIFIAISGRETTRREFLALIRQTFNTIHRSFADLTVTEWVPVPGYPNHPPLKYRELLGLEKMKVQELPIGELGITVNVRELLEGYEPLEIRQRRVAREEQEPREVNNITNNFYSTPPPEQSPQESATPAEAPEAQGFFSRLIETATPVRAAAVFLITAIFGGVTLLGGVAEGLNNLNDLWDNAIERFSPEQPEE